MIKITTPLTSEVVASLKAGDEVLLTGIIYTGRDAAHKRLVEMVSKGEELPFDPMNAVIYYVGPTPTKPGKIFGSAGPTTSGRMDAYAPTMLSLGLRGMIGKGYRNEAVHNSIKEHTGVYFGAIGGAGAMIGKCVKTSKVIAFDDLGPEAIRELYVEDFPLTVIIDSNGNDLYELGKQMYLDSVGK